MSQIGAFEKWSHFKITNGTNTNIINFDSSQINSQIASTSDGLNNKTLGYGLTFLHELSHTKVGGSFNDPQDGGFSKGPTVERIIE